MEPWYAIKKKKNVLVSVAVTPAIIGFLAKATCPECNVSNVGR